MYEVQMKTITYNPDKDSFKRDKFNFTEDTLEDSMLEALNKVFGTAFLDPKIDAEEFMDSLMGFCGAHDLTQITKYDFDDVAKMNKFFNEVINGWERGDSAIYYLKIGNIVYIDLTKE